MFLVQCSRAVQLHKTKDTATVQTKGKETEQMTGNAKKNKRTTRGKQDERTMKGLGPGTWVKWKGGRQGSVLSSMLRARKACRYHVDSKLFWGRIAASYIFSAMFQGGPTTQNKRHGDSTNKRKGNWTNDRKRKEKQKDNERKARWKDNERTGTRNLGKMKRRASGQHSKFYVACA